MITSSCCTGTLSGICLDYSVFCTADCTVGTDCGPRAEAASGFCTETARTRGVAMSYISCTGLCTT